MVVIFQSMNIVLTDRIFEETWSGFCQWRTAVETGQPTTQQNSHHSPYKSVIYYHEFMEISLICSNLIEKSHHSLQQSWAELCLA
jgi:hypothetical protein